MPSAVMAGSEAKHANRIAEPYFGTLVFIRSITIAREQYQQVTSLAARKPQIPCA